MHIRITSPFYCMLKYGMPTKDCELKLELKLDEANKTVVNLSSKVIRVENKLQYRSDRYDALLKKYQALLVDQNVYRVSIVEHTNLKELYEEQKRIIENYQTGFARQALSEIV